MALNIKLELLSAFSEASACAEMKQSQNQYEAIHFEPKGIKQILSAIAKTDNLTRLYQTEQTYRYNSEQLYDS